MMTPAHHSDQRHPWEPLPAVAGSGRMKAGARDSSTSSDAAAQQSLPGPVLHRMRAMTR